MHNLVKCVLLGLKDSKETWCGRKNVVEWTFVDACHAALYGRADNRLRICLHCVLAIEKTLHKNTGIRCED